MTEEHKPATSAKFIGWFEFRLYTVFALVLYSMEIIWLATYLKDVYDEPDLLSWPYSPYITPSLWIPLIPAAIGVLWALAVWIPKFQPLVYHTQYWVALAAFRALAAAFFLVGAVLKSLYLPLPLGSCEDEYYWRDPPDNLPNYTPPIFFMLPDREGRYGKSSPCKRLVSIWRLEISLVVVLLVVFLPSPIFVFLRARAELNGSQGGGLYCCRPRPRGRKEHENEDMEIQPLNNTYERQ